MNPLDARVLDILADRYEAVLFNLVPAVWPVSGDELARYKAGVR